MKYFVDVILVFLSPVFLSERLPVLCFGGGSHMPVSVGPCLHYVHHSAAGLGVPPEVVRITSYQHPSQARYRMFQFHFSHSFLNSYFLILNSARFCIRHLNWGPRRALTKCTRWGERSARRKTSYKGSPRSHVSLSVSEADRAAGFFFVLCSQVPRARLCPSLKSSAKIVSK